MVTYSVSQRTREIGIRLALGAARRDVLGMVVRQSVALTAVGIAIGLAAAAGTSRYLESMLFGVTALDPSTFVVVAVAFAAVSTLASYVPARRAAQVSPMVALRAE